MENVDLLSFKLSLQRVKVFLFGLREMNSQSYLVTHPDALLILFAVFIIVWAAVPPVKEEAFI